MPGYLDLGSVIRGYVECPWQMYLPLLQVYIFTRHRTYIKLHLTAILVICGLSGARWSSVVERSLMVWCVLGSIPLGGPIELFLVSAVAEQRGRHIYRSGNFARKCISTTPIRASIYIWPRAAIPPAPPLRFSAPRLV